MSAKSVCVCGGMSSFFFFKVDLLGNCGVEATPVALFRTLGICTDIKVLEL